MSQEYSPNTDTLYVRYRNTPCISFFAGEGIILRLNPETMQFDGFDIENFKAFTVKHPYLAQIVPEEGA